MADPASDRPDGMDKELSEICLFTQHSSAGSIEFGNIHDSTYISLKSHYMMQGRGRRPELPVVTLTNKLLVQFHFLKEEANANWDTVLTWFAKLFPCPPLTAAQFQYRVQKAYSCFASRTEENLNSFLNEDVNFHVMPSDDLCEIGLNSEILLGDPTCYSPPSSFVPTIGTLLSLDTFRLKENLSERFIFKWIQALIKPLNISTTLSQIKHKLLKAKKQKVKLKTDPKALEEFLNESLFVNQNISVTSSKISESEGLKLELENEKKVVKSCNDQIKCFSETLKNLQSENALLKLSVQKVTGKNVSLESKICILQKEVANVENELRETRKAKLIKSFNKGTQTKRSNSFRLRKLEQKLLNCQEIMTDNVNEIRKLKDRTNLLKNQKRKEQKLKSKYKKQLEDTLSTAEAILCEDNNCDCQPRVPNLKGNNNKNNTFSDDVHITYMALQGEADVAASKCSKVINIVSKYLYRNEIMINDLPCIQTALNCASEAYFLSKTQAVESILDTNHFTFGIDETSRQKRRYLERHIVLSNGGTLSLGFTEIPSEDADTLLMKSIALLNELCDIYCETESVVRDNLFKEILAKMRCLMSDRAAVMKLFDKKMANFKKEILGTDCSTFFLFCNAHFLLGVTTAVESCAKEVKAAFDDKNVKLGRDRYPEKYNRFCNDTELIPFRLIRHAADVFGPRPDEKNGCRFEWLMYLESIDIRSRFSCYRTNRFNSVFDNASALLFHKDHIVEFLTKKASNDNMKLQSILDDLADENVMAMVSAVARFNYLFTSPYWKLLNSHVKYGEFPPLVSLMREFLTKADPAETPVFSNFTTPSLNLTCFESEVFHETFRMICLKTTAVLERQLSDFIEDGVFAGAIDNDVMNVLMTAPLSNLIGERLFGDLDFDIGKRRHASLHLRSALNMFKHNKTGQWLSRQKKQRAIDLLAAARKNRNKVRRKSRDEEKEVRRIVKERLEENERKRNAKDLKDREKHLEIVNAVVVQGGLCSSREEIDHLLSQGGNKGQILKAQIRYRKVVLKEKGLILTGDVAHLYDSLVSFLDGEVGRVPATKKKKLNL